jgi:hypothetical protein
MDNTKTKFKKQLRKEKIIAGIGYGNGYTLKKEGKMIGFIPFADINNVYYDWESRESYFRARRKLKGGISV